MDDWLKDRIFDEIDNNSRRLEDVSQIVFANASTLGLLAKLVMTIILFLVLTGAGVLYNYKTINSDNVRSDKDNQTTESRK